MHHRRHARPGERPRNVDWKTATALLYGDWGRSKAYVVGLAFAICGYSSPWLIAVMSLVTALGLRPDIAHAEHGNSANRIQDDPMALGSGQGNLRMGNP
jgi:hypothetical protein